MDEKFLVAIDGSDHAWKALDLASKLAIVSDAELVILHVIPDEPMPKGFGEFAAAEGITAEEVIPLYHERRRIGDNIVSEAKNRARKNGNARIRTRVAEGNPVSQIVALAKSEAASMVFLGSRGLGDINAEYLKTFRQKAVITLDGG